MVIDANPIGLIQIDATIIAGVLILLTITKFARSIGEDMPQAVSWIIVPFGISAIFALIAIVFEEFSLFFQVISIVGMILGFVYLMIAILDLTRKPKKKLKF